MSSTPVRTSKDSLPAFFTSSKAPAKSLANTFFTALAKNPKVSKKELNLSIILFLIAVPNSINDSFGFSNISEKNPVTVPKLFSKNLKKSLKAIDKFQMQY